MVRQDLGVLFNPIKNSGSSNLSATSTSQIGLRVLDTSCLGHFYWASPIGHSFPTSFHSLAGSEQTSSQPNPRPVPAGSVPNGDHTETSRVQVWCPNFASECLFSAKGLRSARQCPWGGRTGLTSHVAKPASVEHWCPLVADRKKATHT